MKQVSKKFLSGQPIIAQLISLIPNEVFDQTVAETGADRYYKQMKTKDHFICLFYAVLTRNSSLREVCKNITLIARKLLYVGLKQLPCRSTLSDANRKRDSQFFVTLYMGLYFHYKTSLKIHGGLIGEEVAPGEVEVFDSTTITLFKDILKGAGRNPIDGKKKGGIKAFTKVNLAEGVPDFICMKAASTNKNTLLKVLNLPEGGIAVFDQGFNKYRCFDEWTQHNCFFVTRLKHNAQSDSENGIKSQICVALILNLLFTLLHRRIREAEDFSTMVMVAAKNAARMSTYKCSWSIPLSTAEPGLNMRLKKYNWKLNGQDKGVFLSYRKKARICFKKEEFCPF